MKKVDKLNSILLIIILFGVLVRLDFSGYQRDFWHDESFQALYSTKPLKEILLPNDVHPPLFNIFTWLIQLEQGNNLSPDYYRTTIILLSLIFMIMFYIMAEYLYDTKTALFSVFFIAFVPAMVYYSTEYRNYMFTLIFVVLQVMVFNRALISDKFKDKVVYVLLSLVIVWSHYMAGLIILVQVLYATFVIKRRQFYTTFLALGVLLVPLLFYVYYTSLKIVSFWFKNIDLLNLVSTYFYIFSFPDMRNLTFGFLFYGMILIYFIFHRKRLRHIDTQMIMYFTIPPVVMFVISQFFPFYHHRYFLFGSIGVYVLAGKCASLQWGKNKVYTFVTGILFIIMCVISLSIIANDKLNTELYDTASYLKSDYLDTHTNYTFVHTSTFSQSPYKIYLPEYEHQLYTNLTREQLFTAGGSVVEDSEIIRTIPHGNNIIYVSNMRLGSELIIEEGGLYVTKN